MGKGDKISKRGKIFSGSYGKTRLRKQKSSKKYIYSSEKREKKHFEKIEHEQKPVTEVKTEIKEEPVVEIVEEKVVETPKIKKIVEEKPVEPVVEIIEKKEEKVEEVKPPDEEVKEVE